MAVRGGLSVVLIGLLVASSTAARADERERARARSSLVTLVAGLVFVSVGSTVAVGHVAAGGAPDRVLALLPVAGPFGVAARDHLSLDWTAGLVFASCAQTIGALTLVLAFGER